MSMQGDATPILSVRDGSAGDAAPGWDIEDQLDAGCPYQEINERRERLENAEALRLARAL